MQHRKSSFIPEPTHMLYKQAGDKFLHGDYFSTKVVKQSELDSALSDGWFKTSTEAKNKNCEGSISLSEELVGKIQENKELAYKVLAEFGYSEDEINESSVLADDLKADSLEEVVQVEVEAPVIPTKKRGPGRPRLSAQ